MEPNDVSFLTLAFIVCAVMFALLAGACGGRMVVTQYPLQVIESVPVKVTIAREPMDTIVRNGQLVNGQLHLDGAAVSMDDMAYMDAVIGIVGK